jgi:hypothetical protein
MFDYFILIWYEPKINIKWFLIDDECIYTCGYYQSKINIKWFLIDDECIYTCGYYLRGRASPGASEAKKSFILVVRSLAGWRSLPSLPILSANFDCIELIDMIAVITRPRRIKAMMAPTIAQPQPAHGPTL